MDKLCKKLLGVKNLKQQQLGEIIDHLHLHVETMEGTHALLEDVLEDLTSANMAVASVERNQEARLKLSVLITLMQHGIDGLNDEIGKADELRYTE